MAYSSTVKLVVGDTLPELNFTLKDSNSTSSGECSLVFPSGTWTAAGTYEGEIEFTKSDGNIQTVQDFIKFKVRDDFD